MGIIIVACFVIVLANEEVIGLFDSCIHGGMKYKEGEFFLPNDTIIKTEGPQQCVQCRCRQGLVLCEIENCPLLDCETPLQSSQFCCLQCPVQPKRKKMSSDFIFGRTGSEEKNSGDCLSNGKHFKNGSAWQPVIGPFGVMACVQCRCQEGSIICGRLECGDVLCSQPRRELGQCCPVCPSSLAVEYKKKAFCLPKSSELFVFKTANVRNNSDRIEAKFLIELRLASVKKAQTNNEFLLSTPSAPSPAPMEYAFLENTWKLDPVKVHTWNLRPKTQADVFSISSISRKEFHERNFQILGSITKRRFKKYSRREKKLISNCFAKCFAKIERLENSLMDYAVNSRNKCAEDEIDVADI